MAGNKPNNNPTFVVPPPPPKQTHNTSTGAAFNAFINAHPTMSPYADLAWKWAGTYGIDKVVFATLLWKESFAAAAAQKTDPATIQSPAGAVGLGQIMPLHVGEKMDDGHVISQSDLTNANMNLKIAAWLFSNAVKRYGDYNSAYNQGYNPGYTGPALLQGVPKGYVPRSGLSPQEAASVSVEKSNDRAAMTDPWAVYNAKTGHLSYVNATSPPAHAVTYGGTPLTKSELVKQWNQVYSDTFFAYTGRHAGSDEIVKILGQAPSVYSLANDLANRPSFVGSPVYKQHAPGLLEDARQIMGRTWKPPKDFVANAISQNWDQATFEAKLRDLPAYQNGPAFQKDFATNQAVYEQVYGTPDKSSKQLLATVTQQGWSTDQFQSWLRAQPAYKNSAEYHSNMGAFANAVATQFGYAPSATLSQGQLDGEQSAGDTLPNPTKTATNITPASPTTLPGGANG